MVEREDATEASGQSITMDTFLAPGFNVIQLVEGMMEEDVRRAKAEGGGECIVPQNGRGVLVVLPSGVYRSWLSVNERIDVPCCRNDR